jgi:hypothetical protein
MILAAAATSHGMTKIKADRDVAAEPSRNDKEIAVPATTRLIKPSRVIGGGVAVVLALVFGVILVSALRDDSGDRLARARWTAETRCGACHDVTPGAQADRRSGVPSFVLLARSGGQRPGLPLVLGDRHPAMPRGGLSAEEAALIGEYLASLAKRRG